MVSPSCYRLGCRRRCHYLTRILGIGGVSFDWLSFLISRNIPFSREGDSHKGKAPARDNVMVHCPFCGGTTPTDYMHVSLTGAGWYCWRRPEHAGRSPARLVAALLGISMGDALAITGQHKSLPSDFLGTVMAHFEQKVEQAEHNLQLPKEFKRIEAAESSKLARSYLQRRGIPYRDLFEITDDYDIRFCNQGAYKKRIIFPVYHREKLITWTSRSIGRSSLRYKTLSTDPEEADREGYKPAHGPITDYLLWYDIIRKEQKATTIIITEGPFDALKIMIIGRRKGIVATCLFTNRCSDAQQELLYDLLPGFRYRFLMLDQGTLDTMLRTCSRLTTLGLQHVSLPHNIKDPGEMELRDLMDILVKKTADPLLLFAKS